MNKESGLNSTPSHQISYSIVYHKGLGRADRSCNINCKPTPRLTVHRMIVILSFLFPEQLIVRCHVDHQHAISLLRSVHGSCFTHFNSRLRPPTRVAKDILTPSYKPLPI